MSGSCRWKRSAAPSAPRRRQRTRTARSRSGSSTKPRHRCRQPDVNGRAAERRQQQRGSPSPREARVQFAILRTTVGSLQCPATVLSRRPILVCMNPSSRSPCADWFQVHERHVELRPGELSVELSVQMQDGLAEQGQSGDPRLRRRKGVHPKQKGPTHVSAAFASRHKSPDRFRRERDPGLDHADGKLRRGIEGSRYLAGVLRDVAIAAAPYNSCAPTNSQTSRSPSGFTSRPRCWSHHRRRPRPGKDVPVRSAPVRDRSPRGAEPPTRAARRSDRDRWKSRRARIFVCRRAAPEREELNGAVPVGFAKVVRSAESGRRP